MSTLHIRQSALTEGYYPIRLTVKDRPGQPDIEAEAKIEFTLSEGEREDLRWYLEDYLVLANSVEPITVQQIESNMRKRGEELYTKVLAANQNTQALWFAIRNDLAQLRVEISTSIAEAASIPWELLRDPQLDSPISLRVKAFVRVQSGPNIGFVPIPPINDGLVRLLYITCRPRGSNDVSLRVIANRLLQGLGQDRSRFCFKVLRPPTFEQLQRELTDANEAGTPYHIVHFDGHGEYSDLSEDPDLSVWAATLPSHRLGGSQTGKRGYLLFENPQDKHNIRPVDGQTLGQLLHDTGVPVLVLNACQSAMHEASSAPKSAATIHDEIRAIGSLSQAVVDQGIPAVLGMRYSVYVVTAAQYVGQLYAALAKGRGFGQAATEGRKHLYLNPDRWVGLQAHPLQDWFVPVVYEALPVQLVTAGQSLKLGDQTNLDPIESNDTLLRYVPEEGFIGRDETLLALDRAFDSHRIVLLHAYAGQGKTSTAVEFARWYAVTGGLSSQPMVLLSSFETHTNLTDLFDHLARLSTPFLEKQGKEWSAVNEPSKRRQLILQLLRSLPLLWIWDNVEPIAGFPEGSESLWTMAEQHELRDFLHQLKADPACQARLLLTSRCEERGWLGGLPLRVRMPRMSTIDAASLTLKLGAEQHLKRSDIADWQPLLTYCAGNPLTLRILVRQAVRAHVRGKSRIEDFVEAVRSGEQEVEDTDEKQGRDRSLGASLDYGFRNAFADDELPIIALLHLFQGTVDVRSLQLMGEGDHSLPEVRTKTTEYLSSLLTRAQQIGFLTHLGENWFTIHPAVPWYLQQLYSCKYDGQFGRSNTKAAERAWVEAIGALGTCFHDQFGEGNQAAVIILEFAEANLLHARRLARRHQWWKAVTFTMQGLRALYRFRSGTVEWARLVDEIIPDFCTSRDEPILGREDEYSIVMSYRVTLAQDHDRDLAKALLLQKKHLAYNRYLTETCLTKPDDSALSDSQRKKLRTLSVSLFSLGQILLEQGNADCIQPYQQALDINRRIGDRRALATSESSLSHAYMQIASIRDLAAAEAGYKRSLNLLAPNDYLGRAACMQHIGMVYHERLRDTPAGKLPVQHVQAALSHYFQALHLCPPGAAEHLGPIHTALGALYNDLGQISSARQHYEQACRQFEQIGSHFKAGRARMNIARMYLNQSNRENPPSEKRNVLTRAQAYIEAALRDFQHYQGRVLDEETKAQQLLDMIARSLGNLQS